ncbi:hypothetical protein [Denitromonas iodatirespirans]|uniref:O-antigen ligase domain-containing protein n=1 Tax=Denitromonas iodatirespirans TaxID=2795389 RepID=A0A944H8K9_DENI1|nr:hypothetical protein [Denitromonas iodatirespirans]MBT0962319.1 hypothetical protein [Denitromonas iodatirespirans]
MLFYLSGIYQIPFADISAVLIAQAKHLIFGMMMLAMAAVIDWKRVRFCPFAIACMVWVLLHVVNFVVRIDPVGIYVQRLGQAAFIWLFVTLVSQSGKDWLASLSAWYSARLVAVACAIVSGAAFLPEVSASLTNGFGNNRVNFSIWLSQFVFLSLMLILPRADKVSEMGWRVLFLVTPVLVLQTFSGGRSGLLASCLLVLWFAARYAGVRGFVMALAYLGLVVPVAAAVAPAPDLVAGTHVFRALRPEGAGWLAWLDRLSSYRIGIAASALETLDAAGALSGVGVGNFKGWAIGGYWQVHNIYIRTLGEFGVAGLVVLVYILTRPFMVHRGVVWKDPRLAFVAVCMVVGMLHPDFLLTAIGTCMIYWLCFASMIREASVLRLAGGTPQPKIR